MINPFPQGPFDIIYVDAPWQYRSRESLARKSILNGKDNTHYNTMTLAELKALPVAELAAPDCLLFHWVVSPMLDDGIDVLKAWGFKYATVAFVWEKGRVNPGHYTMSSVEICLVGKRGRIPANRGLRNVRQFVNAPRGVHSAKPEEVRHRIELMFPQHRRIELFAREAAPGWTSWGNEV